MAVQTKVYNDKICKKIDNKETRKKILEGRLERNDCDNQEVFDFLQLLKRPKNSTTNDFNPMDKADWSEVVKKSKKRSVSSFFSKRNYAMHKIALINERITNLLVKYYNIIITVQFSPERWLKTLVVMIEKGKGPVLGKLRTIQLTEADLKLIMMMFVNIRNKGNIESDERVSKSIYGSRPGYSLEDDILEKRLVFDNSIVTGSHNIYAMADLQACCDRQLSKIGSIVQESVGVEKNNSTCD